MPTRRALVAFSAALTTTAPSSGRAAPWPERPLRWIVGFPPGGAPDLLTRILA
jgi:tripartite-type tricarboxylate transporter receptor subunit TctC